MPEISKRVVWIFLLTILFQGCGTPPPAPVDRRQAPPSRLINHHIVSKGETLFSIAWRYEKDVEKLAAVNNLPSNYLIYPGQRLQLDTSKISNRSRSQGSSGSTKPSPTTSAARLPAKNSASQVSASKSRPSLSTSWRWSWPVTGNVSRRYDAAALFKGIDINSLPGRSVKPAAPGVVVYAGSGLRGYGNLIIIRHNNVFLSAYAHNRKIFVKEGMTVNKGQKIAEVGGDPGNVRRFYFEIRKDGKPVNPLKYLPSQ